MVRSLLAAGLVALMACSVPSLRAEDDELRLRLPGTTASVGSSTTRTLALTQEDEDVETLEMGWRGGFYGGFRGGFVGYRGFYGYRGWGGGFGRPIGWGGGFYRPAFVGGWHRPIGWGWGGGFYKGIGWGGFYRPGFVGTYWAPPVYTAPLVSYGYFPCAVVTETPVTTLEYRFAPSTPAPLQPATPANPTLPRPGTEVPPPMPNADGTYDYNGGPMTPVPMPPGVERDVMNYPRVPTPLTERFVSLTPEPTTGKYIYPAYGEAPRRAGK